MLLDAGMGKTLGMRGVEIPATIWSANALLVAPEEVVNVHRENILAGADIITTNSYGIIRSDLAKENIEDQYERLNCLAGELAQRAVAETGQGTRIAGSLPPLNGSYRPDRVLSRAATLPLYREQVRCLVPFVDLFLCETMSSIEEALAAGEAAAESGKLFFVSFTLHDDHEGRLKSGETVESAIDALRPLAPSGVLANCCLPEQITRAMPTLVASGFEYAGGYANAFARVPKDWLLDGRKESDRKLDLRQDLVPQQYCHFVSDWVEAGANLVGGCCGTTAEHTHAIRQWLAA
jgi:S-methylmethionine-dependent homocysteine/selenocysteine methylase